MLRVWSDRWRTSLENEKTCEIHLTLAKSERWNDQWRKSAKIGVKGQWECRISVFLSSPGPPRTNARDLNENNTSLRKRHDLTSHPWRKTRRTARESINGIAIKGGAGMLCSENQAIHYRVRINAPLRPQNCPRKEEYLREVDGARRSVLRGDGSVSCM